MNGTSDLDPKAVRQQFERRAARIGQADFLLREIEGRMLERLDLVKLAPQLVMDVGSGLGAGAARLQQRYPQATVIGIDSAHAMARAAMSLHGEPARKSFSERLRGLFGAAPASAPVPLFAVADAGGLPVRDDSIGLLWSNLALHWFGDPLVLFRHWRQSMAAGGLLMFSAFGVDTLVQLRALGLRVPQFPDMHDLGDALIGAGFAEPVIDAERMTITWDRPEKMLRELRALGGDAVRGRPAGLRGRQAYADLLEQLGGLAEPAGRIAASIEIVYGHAWVPAPSRLPSGYSPIRIEPRRSGGAS